MFNNWPYTNLNELNLDWILQQVKGIADKYKDLDSAIAAGVEAVQHQEEVSLQDLDNMKMTIVTAINGVRDVAIVDVNATKTNAINDITTAQGTAESAIETDKTNALAAIAALGNTWDAHYESLIAEMPADLASITQTLAILGRILTGESEQTVTFFMGDYAGGSKTDPTPASTSDVSTNMIIGGAGFKFSFTLDENEDADTKIYSIRWVEGKNADTGVYTDEHVVSCGNVRTYNWTVPDTCYGFSITLRNSETLFTEAPASDIATFKWYTTISDFVSVDGDQDFTDEQKAQGRENIGAASANDVTELMSAVDDLNILPVNITVELTDGYRYTAGSVGNNATPSSNASSKYTATAIDLSEYVGKKLKISRSSNPSDNARAFGFVDANNKWVTVYDHREVSYTQEDGLYTLIIPVDTGYFIYSDRTTVANIQFSVIQQASESVCYVDVNGNDNYSGTLNAPFATVSHAIEKGFRNILVRGGVYEQRIALTLDGVISISPSQKTSIPIFVDPDMMKITSATLYTDNIYKATTDFSNLANTPIIFQDGYADTSTSIPADERMPQQRGKTYRCDDTRIYKCAADNLYDAITEMNATPEYKFFYDGTDLYFTAPASDFSSYPICASSDSSLFSGLSRKKTLHVSGIECKYMRFDISNTMNSIIADCKCSCAYASALGQFVFDDAINPRFINCEAAMSHGANNGDGFNAHATNSGDTFSHQSGTILENCWSHDNSDDGYSEHAKGESFIIGGLYEYNGKGGVVPAYGSHCTCIGVVSRHNYSGFLIMGAANDQGIGGQLICISCVAYKNDRGGSSNTGYGFGCYGGTSAKPNTMTCVNCHSIDNASSAYRVGRTNTDTNNYETLINCYESGGLHNHGYGTTTVKNGTLVTN